MITDEPKENMIACLPKFMEIHQFLFKIKSLNLIVVLEDHQTHGGSSSGNFKTLGQFTQEKLWNFGA